MISLNDLLTSSGKYNDRATSPECTDEVKTNATNLLVKVNALLDELNIENPGVSSGFRTIAANIAAGGAAKSHHETGHAIDLQDPNEALDNLFIKNISVLEKHGLYLESPAHTKGWSHLQDIPTHSNPFLP
jgi:hypothetical protein